jgi:hypothetical protein
MSVHSGALLLDYGKPHLTPVGVGCCSLARVCLDRRSETHRFVDPAAFHITYQTGGAHFALNKPIRLWVLKSQYEFG